MKLTFNFSPSNTSVVLDMVDATTSITIGAINQHSLLSDISPHLNSCITNFNSIDPASVPLELSKLVSYVAYAATLSGEELVSFTLQQLQDKNQAHDILAALPKTLMGKVAVYAHGLYTIQGTATSREDYRNLVKCVPFAAAYTNQSEASA